MEKLVRLLPRFIRMRDAPAYLGMDRSRSNAEVRLYVIEIPMGTQSIPFDRLDLDAWADDYKTRNGRRPRAFEQEDDLCRNVTVCRDFVSKEKSGTSKNVVITPKVAGSVKGTEQASRTEAEKYLIRRLAEIEEAARRQTQGVYTFEQAALRYLEEIAHKSSANTMAMHLDQLFPFIGARTLKQVHDGTLKGFVDHETKRGIAPKSINNAIGVVSAVLNRAARVWRDESGAP